jgi:hypothetical protein
VVKLLEKFSTISQNLNLKDINQYDKISTLKKELDDYDNRIRREIKTVDDADVVYEDNEMTVVSPKTHKSSCYFGSGTKWCTAASDSGHYDRYNQDGKLFYFVSKTKPTSDPTYKVALLKKFDGTETYYNAPDDSFRTGWIFGTEKLEKILSRINSYISTTFADQLKIWNDKELAEKERQRLNREANERAQRGQLARAEQRRQTNEWDLEDTDDVGLRANALFKYLVSIDNLQELTPENKSEIARIENEITRLQAEYDNDEEVRGDLLDEISELEDELTELDAKMDVYNMLPTGDYVLKEFTTTEFQGRWKVGDSDDTEREAVRYVKDMLDDVGYDGYNESFVMEHFDDDSFRVYLKDFFEEDVYNNPEVYLDDSDKELSRSQEARIVELKQMVSNLESERDSLDDEDEDYSDEYDRMGDEIDEANNEIEEIENDPDGEYDEYKLDSIVADKISEHRYDAKDFYENYLGGDDFSEWATSNGFINEDDFAQAVVDADGYGTVLNNYDGSEENVSFEGETYYIFYDGDFH